MTVMRTGPLGAGLASFGVAAALFVSTPTRVGYQDIASLLAQEPVVSARWRQHLLTSVGTVRAATFSFPRPIGSAIPQPLSAALTNAETELQFRAQDEWMRAHDPNLTRPPYQLASLTTDIGEAAGSIVRERNEQTLHAPSSNRAAKGDFLGLRERAPDRSDTSASPEEMTEADRTARLLFGDRPFGSGLGEIERWEPGEAPVLLDQAVKSEPQQHASVPNEPEVQRNGESIAPKGEVTGDEQQPKTVAERLGLSGKARTKAERCLADAIYFEARGEPARGQVAVAQVVVNRVFSGYYPDDVCGVVYQNAHRKLACQFTFACDGIPEKVSDREAWQRATRIARETLDGRLWLPDVGKSTHYHATYVRPSWARSMRKLSKIGVHMFYRPHKWGNGDDIPVWGEPSAERVGKL